MAAEAFLEYAEVRLRDVFPVRANDDARGLPGVCSVLADALTSFSARRGRPHTPGLC